MKNIGERFADTPHRLKTSRKFCNQKKGISRAKAQRRKALPRFLTGFLCAFAPLRGNFLFVQTPA
jgi:hypothetical protein